jgi:hypothetical protein
MPIEMGGRMRHVKQCPVFYHNKGCGISKGDNKGEIYQNVNAQIPKPRAIEVPFGLPSFVIVGKNR